MNWINNFIEEQKTLAENKQFLKRNYINNIVSKVKDEVHYQNKLNSIQSKNFAEMKEMVLEMHDEVTLLQKEMKERIQFGKNMIQTNVNLQNHILKLNRKLSDQKGRITRQTNEQNLEARETTQAISNIHERLEKLEA